MKEWRPDDWDEMNPDPCKDCDKKEWDTYGLLRDICWCGEHSAYLNREAGADAILEVLKRKGYRVVNGRMNTSLAFTDLHNGWLVFIEETKNVAT